MTADKPDSPSIGGSSISLSIAEPKRVRSIRNRRRPALVLTKILPSLLLERSSWKRSSANSMICPNGVRSRCKDELISSGEGNGAVRDNKSRSAECLTLSWYETSVAPPKRTNASGKSLKIVTAACSINVLTSARSRLNPLSSYFAICLAMSTIAPFQSTWYHIPHNGHISLRQDL